MAFAVRARWPRDTLRDPSWVVLGAVSRCTATVVSPDGKEYRFSNCANELSSADVGREVSMTAYRTRSGKPTTTFYPSKQLAQNDLGMLLGFLGAAVPAIGGPIAVWPRRRKSPDGAPPNTWVRHVIGGVADRVTCSDHRRQVWFRYSRTA